MRALRVAVPTVLVLTLTGLVLANYLNPARWLRVPTEFGTLVISGSKITMEAPRLAGFTKDQREYSVTATSASQDTKNPTIVEMKEISGRIDMEDKSKVTLTAVEGVYDTKADLLTAQPGDPDHVDRRLSGPPDAKRRSRSRRAVSFPKSRCR